jgi:hypothetical protein
MEPSVLQVELFIVKFRREALTTITSSTARKRPQLRLIADAAAAGEDIAEQQQALRWTEE